MLIGLMRSALSRLSRNRIVRSGVARVIYPTIAQCLLSEIQPDSSSESGIAEAIAWKSHAYLVLEEELRPTGGNCCGDVMRSDRETRRRLFDVALSAVKRLKGDVLEFGVADGQSLRELAERCSDRHVYGFDSFQGLPQDWWTRPKGTFKTTPPDVVRPNVTLVQGWFEDTLPSFLEQWQGQAAILHIDCDLYESTRTCLGPMLARSRKGTVVIFDEYYNYPGFSQHEWRAWREARMALGIKADCIAYDGRRAAFQICATDGAR